MSDHRYAWMLLDLILGAVCILTGYLPLQAIGTMVLALCMAMPIAMIGDTP